MQAAARKSGSTADPCCCSAACLVDCHQKSGTAFMCGFTEFASPSDPPRYYRKKTKKGTITILRFPPKTPVQDCTAPDCTPAALTCRTRGGTASLCGFSEFVYSTPPRKFHTWSVNQGAVFAIRNQSGNKGYTCQFTTADQSRSYDPVSCVEGGGALTLSSKTEIAALIPPCTGGSNSGSGYLLDCADLTLLPGMSTIPNSKTATVWTFGSETIDFGPPCPLSPPSSPVDIRYSLTDEDTEQIAINRLVAGLSWGPYVAGTASSCLARWEQRTAGFDLAYQEAQFDLNAYGLVPGRAYVAQVDVMRSPYGAGTFAFFQKMTVFGVADGAGNLAIYNQGVPNPPGFESYVTNACVLQEDSIVDSWDLTQEYIQHPTSGHVTTCALNQSPDGSTRMVNGAPDSNGPTEADFAGLVTETLTQTTRILSGNRGCVYSPRFDGDPFPWASADGTVTETLSVEDAEGDALARAQAGQVWAPCGLGCGVFCPTYRIRAGGMIQYQSVQVRAKGGPPLAPNKTYKTIIRFSRKPITGSAPWKPYSQYEITWNSGTDPFFWTDWYDEPEEDGQYTCVARSSVVLVP
jgi:hypothetical protein